MDEIRLTDPILTTPYELPYKLQTKGYTVPRKAPTEQQVRDTFQTPRYATELLIPFIPKNITHVWECAAGEGRISRILEEAGYSVSSSDLQESNNIFKFNFLEPGYGVCDPPVDLESGKFSIITNPPFSIKDLFIEKCFVYGVPFALLINADYSGWQIELIKRGCEKIIPTRRVDYITPFILQNIHEGEIYKIVQTDLCIHDTKMKYFIDNNPDLWNDYLKKYSNYHNYDIIDNVPDELLFKYSASQFHSMWLTHGFNIGRTETFVELPIKWKKERIK